MIHLTTIGRRTGQECSVILGYFNDGPNPVTLAMNGRADGEPAWWFNCRAHPEKTGKLLRWTSRSPVSRPCLRRGCSDYRCGSRRVNGVGGDAIDLRVRTDDGSVADGEDVTNRGGSGA